MIPSPRGRVSPLAFVFIPLLAVLCVSPPEIHPGAAGLVYLLVLAAGLLLLRAGRLPSAGERWFLAALGLPLVLSHLFAVDVGGSVDSLLRFGVALLLFAAARELRPDEGRAVGLLLIAAAGLLAGYGLWQYFIGFDRLLAADALPAAAAERLGTYRVFGRFLLPSVFASFLILVLPMAAGLTRVERGWRRIAAALATAAATAALLLTQSHGALLALAATAALWWLTAAGRRPVWAAALTTVSLLGLVLISLVRGGTVFGGAEAAGPVALRLRNYEAAVRMLGDAPVTGVGGGGFGSAYTLYREAGDNETRLVHSTYLQIVVEHGLPVLLPLTAGLLALGRAIRQARRRCDPVLAGAAFGLAAFLVHNLWDVSGMLASSFWIGAAVAGVVAGAGRSEEERRLTAAPGGASFGRLTSMAVLTALLLGGVTVGSLHSLSSRALARSRATLAAGDAASAYEASVRGAQLAPWRAEHPMMQAELLVHHPELAGGQGEAAAAAAKAAGRAVRLNRSWPAAHRLAALALASSGDAGEAAVELWQASSLYPLSGRYRDELRRLAETVEQRRDGRR
jgi:O-antigen ligase